MGDNANIDNDNTDNNNSPLDIRFFLAGGGCASISHGIATPFDVIKTRIQSDPETYEDKSFLDTASALVTTEGWNTLSTGLVPTVVGFGLEGAVKFGVYESLKPICTSLLDQLMQVQMDDRTLPYLLASVGAGAIASIMLCPMERARIKLVTDKEKVNRDGGGGEGDEDSSSSVGLFGGIGPLIQEEGLSSLLFGYTAMLSKQVPYTITKQCSFDLFASSISLQAMSYFGQSTSLSLPNEEIRFLSTVTAAFLASILACITSQPGDVILTKKLKGGGSGAEEGSSDDDSFISLAKGIYQEKGFKGFYAGFSARLFHVAAIVTSQLILYDYLKQLLGLPATASG